MNSLIVVASRIEATTFVVYRCAFQKKVLQLQIQEPRVDIQIDRNIKKIFHLEVAAKMREFTVYQINLIFYHIVVDRCSHEF